MALSCGFLLGCTTTAEPPHPSSESERTEAAEPILPIPLELKVDRAMADLGEALFFSPVLSEDGRASCGSCHALNHGLADRSARSKLPGRPASLTNSTTIFNVRFFYKLGWNGKFDSLEEHLDWLIRNPKLMGTSWRDVTVRLRAEPVWVSRFAAVFADGVSGANARLALLEYERSLVTPNAPFDRWLRGDRAALPSQAAEGYELFKEYGCASCHQGVAVGANLLQRFGVMEDYFRDHPETGEADLGRFNVTKREEDRHVFRVPSLRNVALTAPYFHDGSAPTLESAVAIMARYQLGRDLDAAEVSAIVAFLQSLTGEYRSQSLWAP